MELDPTEHWSEEVEVPVGSVARWRIGSLTLLARRAREFWQIHHHYSDDMLDPALEREVLEAEDPELVLDPRWVRHGFRKSPGALRVRPRLADRPIVTRPEFPFRLPAGEDVTLYVATVLWVEVSVSKPPISLADLPSWRLSDTWFGLPEDGQLCYAARTSCRQDLENLTIRPNRALTPLVIENHGRGPVTLDRISLPVPNLSLYAAGGRLWTEQLTLEHDGSQGADRARRAKGPPPEAGGGVRVALPRTPTGDNFFVRAFSSLFGE